MHQYSEMEFRRRYAADGDLAADRPTGGSIRTLVSNTVLIEQTGHLGRGRSAVDPAPIPDRADLRIPATSQRRQRRDSMGPSWATSRPFTVTVMT